MQTIDLVPLWDDFKIKEMALIFWARSSVLMRQMPLRSGDPFQTLIFLGITGMLPETHETRVNRAHNLKKFLMGLPYR